MITIYTRENTSRLQYVCKHLFGSVLGVSYVLTEDLAVFQQKQGHCINYSRERINHGVQILPQGLLSETDIHPISSLQEGRWGNLFCFFTQEKGDVPFDLFSATFYLLTRYEEYFPDQLDDHGRYRPEESLAYRKGFLEIPLIDRWAYQLKDLLIAKGCEEFEFNLRSYSVVSTFDIDHPYKYRNKGLVKNLYGGLRDLVNAHFDDFRERFLVISHLKPDPYLEAILWIDGFQKTNKRSYYLFVLLGKRGKYGRTTIYPQRRYFDYLRSLQHVFVGLHASYSTLLYPQGLNKERKKLESLLKKDVFLNRQHYLRLQCPDTFMSLHQAGFKEDFSLSYARLPGFRSSTAVPHFFYDMKKEMETTLLIRPTVVMDACLITHLGLTPDEAMSKLKSLASACKSSGGDFLMLWHNTNLSGRPETNPWIKVFVDSYQYALLLELR